MSRPMLSRSTNNRSITPSNRKPSESTFSSKLHDALNLLPQRRSSPTKPTTSAQTTPAKKSSPFSIFSSSRHKPSASAPVVPTAPVINGRSLFGNKASTTSTNTLPQQKAFPTQPLPPLPFNVGLGTKSAPSSRAGTPLVASKPTPAVAPPPIPPVSSLRSRPTVPFASSSRLTEPTAASIARARPTIVSSSSAPPRSTPTLHTRTTSKSKIEAPLPLIPRGMVSPTLERRTTSTDSRTSTERIPRGSTERTPRGSTDRIPTAREIRESPSTERTPTAREPLRVDLRTPALSPRPRPSIRSPTSPPSAFPTVSKPPARLGRKRSKTFPDPSDPHATPPTLSSSMNTATRILEAFEQSPLANDDAIYAARSKSTSPTPIRPLRMSQDDAFRSIPSRARSPGSQRILPSVASIEASGARARQGRAPLHVVTSSAPLGRSTFDATGHGSLPPPPRKSLSPTLVSSSGATSPTNSRRIVRPKPNLHPLQTTPVNEKSREIKPVSPVSPETQPSSASPKTPAALAYVPEPACVTSDSEGGSSRNKRTFKNMFRKPRPDSIVTSTSYTSGVSASGTSNASAFGVRPVKSQKGPGTFGGLPEEDEMPMSTQTRHGIRRHAHAAADVPYPLSFEEMVLQGEKHTQELLSTVLQQRAYHFTPMDNFAKIKNILDVGCGRGFWLADAVKECKNATLVGFDLVDVFLTPQELRDRRGLNDAQIARIKFRQGNFFDSLPFASGEFEYIRLAFLELAIPESKWVPLLKEAWRVLKPGGHIEVVIESQLFPTVWSYDKQPVQQELEDEFRAMLVGRDIPPATNIGEKMFFDAFARVQTHQHVSVCIAPRPAGRSSLDGPGTVSPRNFGSTRSMHSPWSSEPVMSSGMTSPIPFGRPSLDRSRPSVDVLPPVGGLVTSKTCSVPGIVIAPDVFIPVSEETLFTYASHGAMTLNAARLAAFSDKFPNTSAEDEALENEWRGHVERYWQYERSNRSRLGFRMKQFDDDDEDDEIPPLGPTTGRWKWAKCDEDLERPLEIRRFRAWSLSKPLGSR